MSFPKDLEIPQVYVSRKNFLPSFFQLVLKSEFFWSNETNVNAIVCLFTSCPTRLGFGEVKFNDGENICCADSSKFWAFRLATQRLYVYLGNFAARIEIVAGRLGGVSNTEALTDTERKDLREGNVPWLISGQFYCAYLLSIEKIFWSEKQRKKRTHILLSSFFERGETDAKLKTMGCALSLLLSFYLIYWRIWARNFNAFLYCFRSCFERIPWVFPV